MVFELRVAWMRFGMNILFISLKIESYNRDSRALYNWYLPVESSKYNYQIQAAEWFSVFSFHDVKE